MPTTPAPRRAGGGGVGTGTNIAPPNRAWGVNLEQPWTLEGTTGTLPTPPDTCSSLILHCSYAGLDSLRITTLDCPAHGGSTCRDSGHGCTGPLRSWSRRRPTLWRRGEIRHITYAAFRGDSRVLHVVRPLAARPLLRMYRPRPGPTSVRLSCPEIGPTSPLSRRQVMVQAPHTFHTPLLSRLL